MGTIGRANVLDTVKWWSRCDSAHCECGMYAGCKNCTVRDYVENSWTENILRTIMQRSCCNSVQGEHGRYIGGVAAWCCSMSLQCHGAT